jgi:membrane-associated phospholipid phosphatase
MKLPANPAIDSTESRLMTPAVSSQIRLRLEDVIAAVFFCVVLTIKIIFRQLRYQTISPADVLIIIPAVAILLGKELAQYFIGSKRRSSGTAAAEPGDLREFVRPYWEIVRDWLPFLFVLLMYYSLWGDATHLLTTHDRDRELIALDRRLFGFQASVALQHYVRPWLTAWMQFAYAYHIWNIPVVACFLYLFRPRARFREMMCGVLVVSFFGLLGYLFVPAIGPMYTLRDQFTVPLSQPLDVLSRQIEFMDYARVLRDCFPSLHVGISFVAWLYAWRNSKALGMFLSPLILSLWISTVYLRYHYLVDCVAGFILAPLCFCLANFLFARWGEIDVPNPLGAVTSGAWRRKWGLAAAKPDSAASPSEERL